MGQVTINGKTYQGNNIVVNNNSVYIDGSLVEGEDKSAGRILEIKVEGSLVSLKADAPVTVNGTIAGDVKVDGPLMCGDIKGNVNANGPVMRR